jgi:hypothetical protein
VNVFTKDGILYRFEVEEEKGSLKLVSTKGINDSEYETE